MKLRTTFAIGAVAGAALLGVAITEVQVLTASQRHCTLLLPHADETTAQQEWEFLNGPNGPRNLDYQGTGTWVDLDTGQVIGYADAEDDAIYSEPGC